MCHSERPARFNSRRARRAKNISYILRRGLLRMTIVLLFLTIIPPVYAQTDMIGRSQITPASPLYFLKAVREIIELKVAGTARVKSLRELEFATRRIREANSLVETAHEDLIEPTLSRYTVQLRKLNSLASLSDEIVAAQTVESVVLHMSVLQEIYPKVIEPRAKMSIRTAIFKLSEWEQDLISKLSRIFKSHLVEKVLPAKLSGCNFLVKEASSSALNEVEKTVLIKRGVDCYKN